MGHTDVLVAGGVLVFASASFFFALAETSLFALDPWRVGQLAERDPRNGPAVARLLERPSELLATIALGNSVANGSIVVLALWPALSGHWPLAGTSAAALALMLLGCEVLPKTLAVRAPERWALRVARPMLLVRGTSGWFQRSVQWFDQLLLRALVPRSSRAPAALADEEYRELVELAFQQGALEQSEKEIILQIVSLDRRAARDVMRPRSRMDAIPVDLTVEEMIAAARKYKHRRLPICEEETDTIVGVLNTRALLLDPEMDIADAIELPSFVPESMNLLQLLKSLQQQQRGLAIVLDEFGGTAGLVTIGDILECVVGEVRDDEPPTGFVMERLGPGRWRVSGIMLIEDFRREYPGLASVPPVDTMGGLMAALLDVVPAAGDSVEFRGLRLTAQAVDERRVRELRVEEIRRGKRPASPAASHADATVK